MHTETLQNLLDDKSANYDEVKLTPDQKCVAKAMGTKLPFLPTSTKEEQKLFSKLCLENEMKIARITEKWIKRVNGTSAFPKLDAHLRTRF